MKRSAGEVGLNYAVLVVFSGIAIIPLVGVVLSAVTPTDDPQGGFRIPSAIHLGNFVEAWSRGSLPMPLTRTRRPPLTGRSP